MSVLEAEQSHISITSKRQSLGKTSPVSQVAHRECTIFRAHLHTSIFCFAHQRSLQNVTYSTVKAVDNTGPPI